MVRPDLQGDPLMRQGHMGMITLLNDDQTTAHVRFGTHLYGLYDTKDLLMLVPGFVLVDKLRTLPFDDLEPGELIDLMEIVLLDASEDPNHQMKALEMATDHIPIWRAAVLGLDDWIEGFLPDLGDMATGPGRGR